jgi:hypothetical protein
MSQGEFPSFFNSNEEFRSFLNTDKGFYNIDVPDITSPQFTRNVLNYFDDDADGINPKLIQALQKIGGSEKEINFLNDYIGLEDNIQKSKIQENDANKNISNLISKTIESKNPEIWFDPTETLYRGSRVSSDNLTPEIGDTIEFNRFRSTSPDPYVAKKFAQVGTSGYISGETADQRFGKGNKGRFEVIEPLYGGLRVGNPLEGEDSEVLLKPAKFKLIDRKMFRPPHGEDIEFLKYKQFLALDPATAALKGGKDILQKNKTGALFGAATSLLNQEIARAVEKNNYGEAARVLGRDVLGGALVEKGVKTIVPMAGKFAPNLIQTAGLIGRIASPVATGVGLLSQGTTGSLTDVIAQKAAQNPVSWLPSNNPNAKTDLGARGSNELKYMFDKILRGKIPYTK